MDVRQKIMIAAPLDDVWVLVSAPDRQAEWFPDMVSSAMDGSKRAIVTTAGGFLLEEEFKVNYAHRRLEYRITGPFHRVHNLGRTTEPDDLENTRVVYKE